MDFRLEIKSLKNTYGIRVAAALLTGILFAAQADAQTNYAFYNSSALPASGLQNTGDQFGNPFALGLEFSVISQPITVTALGAFDATIGGSGAGFGSTVYVGIYSEATSSFLTSAAFSGHTGTTVGSYQFQNINALTLTVGTYIVIGAGYGIATAPNWNAYVPGPGETLPNPVQFNGSGVLAPGNSDYDDDASGQLEPTTTFGAGPGGGPAFAAGSFAYTVPEPSATELALVGTALLAAVRFGRRFAGTR